MTPQPTNPDEPKHQEGQEAIQCHQPLGKRCEGFEHPCHCHGYKTPCVTCQKYDGAVTPPPQPANTLPTTPIESDPVNAWMLANGWKRYSNDPDDHVWIKNDCPAIDQTLAAEMYRMSEVRVAEARIDERQYAWELINDIRYQNITLDFAKEVTLERLTKLQVEQELAATNPRKEIEG